MRWVAAMTALLSALSGVPASEVEPADVRVVILMYHHFNRDSDPTEPATISSSQFESHLQMLRAEGYHLLTMREFEAFLAGLYTPPDRSVLLTFDDGYASVYDRAFPLLKQYEAPAAIFPIMKYYHTQGWGAWSPHLVYWQTEVMMESGLVDLGGHSYDGHGYVPTGEAGEEEGPFLVTRMWLEAEQRLETEEEYRLRIREDIQRMLAVQAELGQNRLERNHFVPPFGLSTPELLDELRALGFEYVYTTDDRGLVTRHSDPFSLHRFDAGDYRVTAERLQERLEQYFAPPEEDETEAVPVEGAPEEAEDAAVISRAASFLLCLDRSGVVSYVNRIRVEPRGVRFGDQAGVLIRHV